jgi:hypothetical protein
MKHSKRLPQVVAHLDLQDSLTPAQINEFHSQQARERKSRYSLRGTPLMFLSDLVIGHQI